MVIERLLSDSDLAESKKMQVKGVEQEMDVMVEKLLRNLEQMEKDEAMYKEVENHMLSVEGSHLIDLPAEYVR